nr:hypothetical protein [Chloroflexia bacterium]
AVLNSVESNKSGVASAVNGAVREMGFAFGLALLGTIMNQTYKSRFEESSQVQGLRDPSNSALGPLQPVIDQIGEGINYAGQVIYNPTYFASVPGDVADILSSVSAAAFVEGMHRSFIITGVAIIGVAIVSFFLVKDSVAEAPAEEPDELAGIVPAPSGVLGE